MTKKYVITDPCYILPEETWSACCKKCEEQYGEEGWSEHFDGIVEEALKDFTQDKSWANSTLFGDWSNTMYGINVLQDQFCADSGMVAVCSFNDKVQEALKDCPKHCYAVIETEDNVSVEFDESTSDWCVVKITSSNGDNFHSAYPTEEDEN